MNKKKETYGRRKKRTPKHGIQPKEYQLASEMSSGRSKEIEREPRKITFDEIGRQSFLGPPNCS